MFKRARGGERHELLVAHGNIIRYLVRRAQRRRPSSAADAQLPVSRQARGAQVPARRSCACSARPLASALGRALFPVERACASIAAMSRPLSSTEYRLLVEHSPVMIWRADLSANCDYFNETWLAFTGRTLEQELGEGWAAGVHPEDLERCVSFYLDHRRAPADRGAARDPLRV
jgi:PAS domain-containing protein